MFFESQSHYGNNTQAMLLELSFLCYNSKMMHYKS